jgi:hypothetical protein
MTKQQAWVAALVLPILGLASSASGGVDIDFGAAVRVGDDTDLYLAVSSRYFDRDRHEVEAWGGYAKDPDDLAVGLHISRHSAESPDVIFSLRRGGMSWSDVCAKVAVPLDVWFVPVRHDPGPPYGKAYGHWKKHGHQRHALVLSDGDIRNLMAVRMIHEYYGVPVEMAMEWRASGKALPALVSEEYTKRHGNKHGKGHPPGKGQGNGKANKKK